MKKRIFLKSLLLIIGSFPLKIFSYQNKENITFDYGVASGDPTNSHIILWTKISKENNDDINMKWQVSSDINFENIIASGTQKSSFTNNLLLKSMLKFQKNLMVKKIFLPI